MKFYYNCSSKYINYLDDVLSLLNRYKQPQYENEISPIFYNNKSYNFIDYDRRRFYFRLSCLYLEEKGLVKIGERDTSNPIYSISFKGFTVIDNGGLSKETFLFKFNGFIQRLLWVVTLIVLSINLFIHFCK